MKIESIKLKNVKSFKNEIEIRFDDKFNILIGSNGGGKSNFLDIITIVTRHFFTKSYRVNERNDNGDIVFDIQANNVFNQIHLSLEKFIGDSSNSIIEITYKVTDGDISNLKLIKTHQESLENRLKKYVNKPISNFTFCKNWDFRKLKTNKLLTYKINNNALANPAANTPEKWFLEYLNHLELFLILSAEENKIPLKPIFLYFSPTRGANANDLNANLSQENYYDLLVKYFQSTSKSSTSLIKLATNYFASKRLVFEGDPNSGYQKKWEEDEEVKLVSSYLSRLKYDWNLKKVDPKKNIYSINLKKDGKDFLIAQASSGEKEIINFLLGIFAFNIKHGLVIIDEPELHLHPKWQSVLIDLFYSMAESEKIDNQFILSTHSPMFINNKTVANAIRVYKDDINASNLIGIEKRSLGTAKDLLHIVNSHNNQKIFFADIVVLVEGVHDRIVFEKLIQNLGKDNPNIIEVVEVHSKNNLLKYRKFLDLFNVKNYIISDRDYLLEIGSPSIKSLFVTDNKKIDSQVLKAKKSIDRKTISEKLESAINTKDIKDLKEVWEYVKSRVIKIKSPLTPTENKNLKKEIKSLRIDKKIIVLPDGEIEDYLPISYKKLDKTLELLKPKEFTKWVTDNSNELKKLKEIVIHIIKN